MRDRAARAIHFAASLLLFLAVLMMTVQVVLRTFFSAPLAWVEEVVRYAFVWVVYLGTVLAVMADTHIRVTVAVDQFGPWARRASDWLSHIINLVCFAYLAWWGFDLGMKYKSAGFYTVPGVPLMLFYLAVPVSSLIIIVFLLLPGGVRKEHEADTDGL